MNEIRQTTTGREYTALDGKRYSCACLRCYGSSPWCPVKKFNEDARTVNRAAADAGKVKP